MNTKRITYLAAPLALATAAASCEHEEIYEPLEFSEQLAPPTTYRTGDPVVFNFSGNADFITVWTGDTGHEYKHRNRTKVDIADIESCELEIEISQQYGTLNNLVLFAGNKFAGLNGSDAATDRPVVEAIAANDCADYVLTRFSDLTRKVTMQNLFHDGGFSPMGMSRRAMRTYEKGLRFEDVHEHQFPFGTGDNKEE